MDYFLRLLGFNDPQPASVRDAIVNRACPDCGGKVFRQKPATVTCANADCRATFSVHSSAPGHFEVWRIIR